mmetsp:Transcript_56617/g.123821  ORF Transcript_56617/g.123821 Transcript_56617/m.123821 type:complete len:109 (+) Transcript_56617:54-380(+)
MYMLHLVMTQTAEELKFNASAHFSDTSSGEISSKKSGWLPAKDSSISIGRFLTSSMRLPQGLKPKEERTKHVQAILSLFINRQLGSILNCNMSRCSRSDRWQAHQFIW